MGSNKILIVDDNKLNRDILVEYILKFGYEPICAENGLLGLEIARKELPDLILLDMFMPVLTGLEMLKQLKSEDAVNHIPVLIISALGELKRIAECIITGADDYLVTPYNEVLLHARIKSCLEKKRLFEVQERRRCELERGKVLIESKNKDLGEANKKLKRLLQICSHELRNPLGQVLLCSENLLEICQPGIPMDEEGREFLKVIHHSSLSMEAILSDALAYLIAQSNQSQQDPGPLDINNLVNQSIDNMKPSIQNKNIQVQLFLAANLPHAVGDRGKFLQAIDNYVNNAIKYSPSGSMITIRTRQNGNKIRVEVGDEGPGISEKERHLLFRTFAKLSNTPTGDEKKVGLGLSIVRSLIKDQGGTVGAHFPLGKGSVFWLQLPLRKKEN